MTQLSNANLLDDNVKGNLKSVRLEKTSQIAENPNDENVVKTEQIQEPKQTQIPIPKQKVQSTEREMQYSNEQIPNNLPVKDYSKKQVNNDSDEKKILGLKPIVFYGLLAVGLGVAGYFAYKKFGKKGKSSKITGAGDGSSTSTPTKIETTTPTISEVPIT